MPESRSPRSLPMHAETISLTSLRREAFPICCDWRIVKTEVMLMQFDLTEEQRAELDYRLARYEQSPSDVIPWEQVRAGLFKKQ